MELVNILENDAFTMASMSRAIQTAATTPRELGQAGIFTPEAIRTEVVAIEHRDGQLQLAPLDERGAPFAERTGDARNLRYFKTKRVAMHDRLSASDLAFVRQFDSEELVVNELQTEIARRQTGPTGLMSRCEARLEHMRLGALQGLLVDHNGDTVYDFYAEFGISAPPTVFLDIANSTEGTLRTKIESQVTRPMRRKAKGRVFSGVGAYCGEGAWDALMANAEFRKRYEAAADAREAAKLTDGTLGLSVNFAGVTWREYFGADDGSSVNLGATDIRFYPMGDSGIFRHIMSPGETFSDLGQLGKDWYSYLAPDQQFGGDPRWIDLYVATYPMIVNTAPELSIPGSSAAS